MGAAAALIRSSGLNRRSTENDDTPLPAPYFKHPNTPLKLANRPFVCCCAAAGISLLLIKGSSTATISSRRWFLGAKSNEKGVAKSKTNFRSEKNPESYQFSLA